MGTHPIFESDFDCLTEMGSESSKHGSNSSDSTIKNTTQIQANQIGDVIKDESTNVEVTGNTITNSNFDSSITTSNDREKK